jgi:hypothetical protein
MIFSGQILGQTTIPETPSKNTNNQNNNTISTGESYADSLILKEVEQEEIQTRSEKKSKVAGDKEYRTKAPQSLKEEDSKDSRSIDATQSQSVSTMSSAFSYSKQQASTQRTQRSPSAIQQQQMDQIVDALGQSAPESFEYHYFKYIAGNYDVSLIDDLKKAEAIKPANSDVQAQMAAYYLITKDSKNALSYLDKLVASSRLSKDAIDYAEDILNSVEANGVLITHGFDDSYGVAYVQLSKKLRTDVRLISLDLLQSSKYRENLKAEGFNLPVLNVVNVQYLQELCIKNPTKTISVSMTTPKEYLSAIQQNLFTVGLVFEYHTDLTFNNFEKNDNLWNKVLTKKLVDNATSERSKQLSSNYLPMMLVLRKVYDQKNEKEKVKEIDKSIDKVSVQCNKYDQVQKLKSTY